MDIHGTDVEQIRKIAEDAGSDLLRELLQMTVQQLMSAEVDARCGAPYGAPSPDRVNQCNGHRTRRWDTRVGSIDLQILKLRTGSYYPGWLLEPRTRSEKALTAVVAEAYLSGVSTRRVEDLAQSLGIESLSKSQVSDMAKSLDEHVEAFRSRDLSGHAYPYVWLDATCVKVREGGRVVNVAVVLAIGVSMTGHREVLGMDIVTVEDDHDMQLLIQLTLQVDPRLEVSGTCSTAGQAVECARRMQPSLVILDHFIDGNVMGLDAAPAIKAAAPNTAVLLFTSHDLLIEAEREPAVDRYLPKRDVAELMPTVLDMLGLEPVAA